MIRTFFLIMLLLFGLCLISCSEGEETVIARFDENGVKFSPAIVQGAVEYANTMTPTGVRLVLLNSELDSIDMVELPVKGGIISIGGVGSSYSYSFRSEPLYLESPLVKVVSIFSEDGVDMEFCQYLNVVGEYAQLQHLVGALAFERETYLMKGEGYKFEEARVLAETEIRQALGMFSPGFQNVGLKTERFSENYAYFVIPYFYCRYFESYAQFYKDYQDLRERARKGSILDSEVKLRVADGALRFEEKVSSGDYGMTSREVLIEKMSFAIGAPLWDEVYDIHIHNSPEFFIGATQTIKNKDSDFDGFVFVVDGHQEYFVSENWKKWRLVSPLEDALGLCLNDSSLIRQYKNDYYLCAKNSYVWQKIDERDSILTYLYGKCDRYSDSSRVRIHQDTMFHCVCKTDAFCRWEEYTPTADTSDRMALRAELNARAVYAFGECKNNPDNNLKKQQLDDSTYVQCTWGTWESISYEVFWMPDDATVGQVGVLPDGRYVQYAGNSTWKEIPPPVYYGNTCNTWFMHNTAHWVPGWSHINEVAYYAGTCNEKNEGSSADVPTDSTTLHLVCRNKPSMDEAYNMLNGYGWVEETPVQEGGE